jgi:hypothetical protein
MSKSTRSKRSSADARRGARALFPARGGGEGAFGLIFPALGLAAVAVGVAARLWAIGRWPVSFDEFLMGKSVRNILASGVPRFADGGYYVRGLLVQYALAGARLAGLGEELSLRIVPALFNLAAIPAVFLLARRIAGRSAAWVAVSAFALSAWEIEFSRFARMYAPLQAIFVWFAYFLDRLMVEKDGRSRAATYLLAAAGIVVHETSVFLAALLFLPLAVERRVSRARDLVLPVALLAAAVYVNATDFRSVGAAAAAAGAKSGLAGALGKILTPSLLTGSAVGSGGWLAAVVALACFSGWAIYATLRQEGLPARARSVLCACVALAFANLFAAVAILVVLAFLAGWLRREEVRVRSAIWPAAAVAACALAWGAYVAAQAAARPGPAAGAALAIVASPLFSWPNVLGRVLLPWIGVLPRFLAMSALLLLLGAAAGVARAKGAAVSGFRRLGIVLVLGVLLVGLVKTPYVSTRYSFFLYPLLLILDAAALDGLARRLFPSARAASATLLALSAVFLAVSEDVRADRLFRAATLQTNFRLEASWAEWNHYVPRVDYRTPAEFIRANRAPGDTVVSLALPADFYLDRPLEAFYLPREDPEFRNHFDRGSGRDRWTGARIVSDEESLFRLIDGASGTTWVVSGTEAYPYKQAVSRRIAERYARYGRFRSLDGRLGVYAIPRNPPGEDP